MRGLKAADSDIQDAGCNACFRSSPLEYMSFCHAFRCLLCLSRLRQGLLRLLQACRYVTRPRATPRTFRATISFVCLSRALYTTPYVPSPKFPPPFFSIF